MSNCLHSFFVKNNVVLSIEKWDNSIQNSGKLVYEVIRVIDGIPLFVEDHLERFFQSIKISGLKAILTSSEIEKNLKLLIHKNGVTEGNIMFAFHYPVNQVEPSFLAWFIPHFYPSFENYQSGVPLILYHAERENRQAKLLNIGLREAIQQKIKSHSAFEALLVDREGYITEGSKSNFFAIRKGEILTAPAKEVLLGITRKYVFEICRKENIPIREEKVQVNQLQGYEACFISGTSPKILPASNIGSIKFENPHEIIKTIMKEYDLIIEKYILQRT